MDRAERLADYLSGALDADEHAALDAELARDVELRAQLDAMRRADDELANLPPVAPPPGYEARLEEVLGPVLAEELGTTGAMAPAGDTGAADPSDELAARRARRRWAPALTGAAAALVLVVGGIAVTTMGPLGGDDSSVGVMEQDTEAPADLPPEPEAEDGVDAAQDDADLDAPAADTDEEEAAMAAAPDAVGPVVVVGDRDLDDDAAEDLLFTPELDAVRFQALGRRAGEELGAVWTEAMRTGDTVVLEGPVDDEVAGFLDVAPAPDAAVDDSADEQTADQGTAGADADRRAAVPELRTRIRPDDLDDLDRCLDQVDDLDGAAVPVYAEFGRSDGRDAIALVLATLDPDSDRYEGGRSLVLDRDDCSVLRRAED